MNLVCVIVEMMHKQFIMLWWLFWCTMHGIVLAVVITMVMSTWLEIIFQKFQIMEWWKNQKFSMGLGSRGWWKNQIFSMGPGWVKNQKFSNLRYSLWTGHIRQAKRTQWQQREVPRSQDFVLTHLFESQVMAVGTKHIELCSKYHLHQCQALP